MMLSLLDASRVMKLYPSQTKILDGLTKDEIQIFDIPFKGVSTRFGLRTIAKYIDKSGFHLLSILPKSSFGEHKLTWFKSRVCPTLSMTSSSCALRIYKKTTACRICVMDNALFEITRWWWCMMIRCSIHRPCDERYGEQKIAQFRTHYLTKELAYVSTQQSGQDTMDTKMI